MTPAREAILLPVLFLTVLLLASIRFATPLRIEPPSVFALLLGVLLVRLTVQSGALAPGRLLSASRTPLANVNGAVLCLVLWAAASQTMAVLIPDTGLPRVAMHVFFFVLLLNTAAADPDRVRLLRSLAVTFGAAFLLKFVVLHELSMPGSGRFQRVLQAMLDGITLGVLMQPAGHPAAGYAAFFAVALFLTGVLLLPHRVRTAVPELPRKGETDLWRPPRTSDEPARRT